MDHRERIGDTLVSDRLMLKGHQAGIWTALPAIFQGFGQGGNTANVQPAIQGRVRNPQGVWTFVNLPICGDCPIVWPGAGGYVLTFPLQVGDEGLLVFASRCIDAWWQSGGVQPQAELRMHDLSDGFFFPSPLSQAKALKDVSTTTAQLRSVDGSSFIEMAAGGVVNIKAPGGLHVDGPITSTGEVTGNNVKLSTHVHGGVSTGTGSTAAPTAGT